MTDPIPEEIPTFDCPRRADMVLWGATKEQWVNYIETALDPKGHPVYADDGREIPPKDHWRNDGTCSYCGSMSPERLFAVLGAGAQLGPTDKNYKIYVDVGDQEATMAQRSAVKSAGGGGKFYTVNLNSDNALRLRTMIMEGTVAIGYPGYFYNGIWLPVKPTEP